MLFSRMEATKAMTILNSKTVTGALTILALLLSAATALGSKDNPALTEDQEIDIRRLLTDAEDGDEIYIPLGTYIYSGALEIYCDNLTIICEPGTQILVSNENANVISIHGVNNFHIENARLSHLEPREDYNCHGNVIDIMYVDGVTILNCDINGCGAVGVYARQSENLLIQNCWIHENTFNAIYLQTCSDVYLLSNLIENNANFFQVYDTSGFQASDNLIRNNGGYWIERDPNPGMTINMDAYSEESGD
jgi:hypothetical protein